MSKAFDADIEKVVADLELAGSIVSKGLHGSSRDTVIEALQGALSILEEMIIRKRVNEATTAYNAGKMTSDDYLALMIKLVKERKLK